MLWLPLPLFKHFNRKILFRKLFYKLSCTHLGRRKANDIQFIGNEHKLLLFKKLKVFSCWNNYLFLIQQSDSQARISTVPTPNKIIFSLHIRTKFLTLSPRVNSKYFESTISLQLNFYIYFVFRRPSSFCLQIMLLCIIIWKVQFMWEVPDGIC